MAKFDKKKLAEACEGLQNAVVNQLCNENLPKKHEDWARTFEAQAEKAIEENNKLLPYAFAQTLKIETEALAKMFPNNKQNNEIMKENTTIFVVMTGDTPEAAFSQKAFAEQFITTHERDYHTCIEPLTLDKADRYFDPEQYAAEENLAKNAFSAYDSQKPTPKQDERVNHPKHYQHPSGVECITVARHHDFNIGNALKYLWRAGLKQEQGITPLDKQIEDLKKAVFYIQDEIQFLKSKQQEQ